MLTQPSQEIARCVLVSVNDELIVLTVPNTSYQLHLAPTVPAAEITTPAGKRMKGVITAQAMRLHPAKAGGRFIEPVHGAPRIINGKVLAVDGENDRLLIDAAVPMWVKTNHLQHAGDFAPGDLLNFYVHSNTTFTPA